jgi:hypothetical protein
MKKKEKGRRGEMKFLLFHSKFLLITDEQTSGVFKPCT